MKVREEIERYADEEDKESLLTVFNQYHWSSQWNVLATCDHVKYGNHSYQTHRKWRLTLLGAHVYMGINYANIEGRIESLTKEVEELRKSLNIPPSDELDAKRELHHIPTN